MKVNKIAKGITLVFLTLSILFILLYWLLQVKAKACDPVYEIKRHNALIKASKQFLYMFITSLSITVVMFGTSLAQYLKQKNNK